MFYFYLGVSSHKRGNNRNDDRPGQGPHSSAHGNGLLSEFSHDINQLPDSSIQQIFLKYQLPSTEQLAVRDTKIPKTLGSRPWEGRYGYRCLIQKASFFQKEGYGWRCRFRGSRGKWRKWSLTLGSRGWVGVGRNWKWGAGKKMSLQMRATAWWVSHGWKTSNVWGLHSPVGWNHRMCKGIKATRLCGKVMVTPWSPEWQEKHHLADSSHLGRRILETDFITSGIHYPTGKIKICSTNLPRHTPEHMIQLSWEQSRRAES